MAIVAMKRVTIVGPAGDRDGALRGVREAGVLHVVPRREPGPVPPELVAERERVTRVLGAPQAARTPVRWPGPDAAREALARERQRLDHRAELRATAKALHDERAAAAPWGTVDPDDVRWLAGHGVHVLLHHVVARDFDEAALDDVDWAQVQPRRRGPTEVIAVALDPRRRPDLPALALPSRAVAAIDEDLAALAVEQAAADQAALTAEPDRAVVQAHGRWLDECIETHRVRTGSEDDGALFILDGYCPASRVPGLHRALERSTVVAIVQAPGPDDDVPVALANGPLTRTFEPLVTAFKLPGYTELDPTPLIAPFMGMFFGFCLGDLGYGAVLAGLSWLGARRSTMPTDGRRLLRWTALLGVWTMVIGALLGNVFGVRLYTLVDLAPDALLFTLVEEPKTFFYASLAFGVVQLSLGMAIRLVRLARQRKPQAALGALAWLLVLPTVGAGFTGALPWWPLLVVCLALLVFASPEGGLVRRLGGGAWALYNVSGLLGNVASYARIFGLGLSSGIIAMVVNTIAATLADGVLGWLAAIVVLVVGHGFNFAMAVIGSVVHPARLQLLEFFGTFFEGGGRPYAPFSTHTGDA